MGAFSGENRAKRGSSSEKNRETEAKIDVLT